MIILYMIAKPKSKPIEIGLLNSTDVAVVLEVMLNIILGLPELGKCIDYDPKDDVEDTDFHNALEWEIIDEAGIVSILYLIGHCN